MSINQWTLTHLFSHHAVFNHDLVQSDLVTCDCCKTCVHRCYCEFPMFHMHDENDVCLFSMVSEESTLND